MKVSYSQVYKYNLPPNHRFPMQKYDLLMEQLTYEGTLENKDIFHPDFLEEDVLLNVHTHEYWQKLKNQTLNPKEIRRIGFPMTKALIDRGRFISMGTLQCALYAIENNNIGLNIAGGTHHAFADHGEGFCVFNDIAIASKYLINKKIVNKILIIDLDVHQGNGTAEIFKNEPKVFTLSIHGEKNYPLKKNKSNLDIGLPDATTDKPYLILLENTLNHLLVDVKPDFLFFLSGVDVLESDKLGRLSLSMQGCKKRDQLVFQLALQNNLPIAVSMGGGYSPKIAQIVDAHANTFRLARDMFT